MKTSISHNPVRGQSPPRNINSNLPRSASRSNPPFQVNKSRSNSPPRTLPSHVTNANKFRLNRSNSPPPPSSTPPPSTSNVPPQTFTTSSPSQSKPKSSTTVPKFKALLQKHETAIAREVVKQKGGLGQLHTKRSSWVDPKLIFTPNGALAIKAALEKSNRVEQVSGILAMNRIPRNGYRHNIMATFTTELILFQLKFVWLARFALASLRSAQCCMISKLWIGMIYIANLLITCVDIYLLLSNPANKKLASFCAAVHPMSCIMVGFLVISNPLKDDIILEVTSCLFWVAQMLVLSLISFEVERNAFRTALKVLITLVYMVSERRRMGRKKEEKNLTRNAHRSGSPHS